jgi:hypothetical protein
MVGSSSTCWKQSIPHSQFNSKVSRKVPSNRLAKICRLRTAVGPERMIRQPLKKKAVLHQ